MPWVTDPDEIPTILATRRARFAAFLIDQAIAIATVWFARYLTVGVASFVGYLGLLVLSIVQIILLGMRGQTIGKMVLKIAIVDRIDKSPPGFVRAALIRQLPLMVISAFAPAFALVYLIVDGLPIFTTARRCVHDRLAGTIVIDAVSVATSS